MENYKRKELQIIYPHLLIQTHYQNNVLLFQDLYKKEVNREDLEKYNKIWINLKPHTKLNYYFSLPRFYCLDS